MSPRTISRSLPRRKPEEQRVFDLLDIRRRWRFAAVEVALARPDAAFDAIASVRLDVDDWGEDDDLEIVLRSAVEVVEAVGRRRVSEGVSIPDVRLATCRRTMIRLRRAELDVGDLRPDRMAALAIRFFRGPHARRPRRRCAQAILRAERLSAELASGRAAHRRRLRDQLAKLREAA